MTPNHNPAGDRPDGRVRIPADVERDDQLLAGLTARQLALLAVPAVVLWAGYLATRQLVPLPVFAALAAPIALTAAVLALGRRDGLPLDRLVLAGLRHARSPHRLVPAPDGIPDLPAWAGHHPTPAPAPLVLPARQLGTDGVIGLGGDGAALACGAAAVSFALRTPAEQHALIAGFGRYLNSLTAPVQILVRSEPVDLTATVIALQHAAGGLPHPGLEIAARAHATFLTGLAGERDLLTRQVLLVLPDPAGGADAAGRLQRRAADATAALAVAGVALTVLDGPNTARVLAAAADPWAPPRPAGLGGPDDLVTAAAAGTGG